jgi:hypothetical protein
MNVRKLKATICNNKVQNPEIKNICIRVKTTKDNERRYPRLSLG